VKVFIEKHQVIGHRVFSRHLERNIFDPTNCYLRLERTVVEQEMAGHHAHIALGHHLDAVHHAEKAAKDHATEHSK